MRHTHSKYKTSFKYPKILKTHTDLQTKGYMKQALKKKFAEKQY